jgi:hypothetical protein
VGSQKLCRLERIEHEKEKLLAESKLSIELKEKTLRRRLDVHDKYRFTNSKTTKRKEMSTVMRCSQMKTEQNIH